MIDHLTLKVRDLQRSKRFLALALAPLGYAVKMELEGTVGMGEGAGFDLWLAQDPDARPVHLAFSAPNRKAVEAFHAAALAAGAKDNGRPGLRPHYHADYYAAFVLDENGHNLEAVVHRPE
jgi:catechol 2,3-dioxygenase-like lactoylglutathione lyase family enzyme